MALVHGSAQWRLVDYLGVEASKIVYFGVDDAKTVAQITSDLTAFAALLDPVTDAATAGTASFSINFPPTNLKTTANEGNPMTTGGLTSYQDDGAPKRTFSDLIPAVSQDIIANGHLIETALTAYPNYVAEFVGPLTNITLESNFGRLLLVPTRNDINTRKHRRVQQRVTTEAE